MKNLRHYDLPLTCVTNGNPVGLKDWLGAVVTYVSATEREYDALVTSTHDNRHKNTKGKTLPLACLEFRNERGKIVRKHRVPPSGWAYWCSPENSGLRQVWKPK